MLDLLPNAAASPLSERVYPRPRFRPFNGIPKNIRFLRETPPVATGLMTEAQKAGLRYETKVRFILQEKVPNIKLGAWFSFRAGEEDRICQIDALWLINRKAYIFEIKRNHCLEAWQQLRLMYQPLIKIWRPELDVFVVEICRSFDPMVALPEPSFLIRSTPQSLEGDKFFVWRLEV